MVNIPRRRLCVNVSTNQMPLHALPQQVYGLDQVARDNAFGLDRVLEADAFESTWVSLIRDRDRLRHATLKLDRHTAHRPCPGEPLGLGPTREPKWDTPSQTQAERLSMAHSARSMVTPNRL